MSASVLPPQSGPSSGKQQQQPSDALTGKRATAGLLSGLLLGHSAASGRGGGGRGGSKPENGKVQQPPHGGCAMEGPKDCSHEVPPALLPSLLDAAWMTGLRSLPAASCSRAKEQQQDPTARQKPHAATPAHQSQQQLRAQEPSSVSQPTQQAPSSSTPEYDSFCAEACSERSHGPRSLCMRALSQQQGQHHTPATLQPAHVPHQPAPAPSTLPIPSAAHTQSAPQQACLGVQSAPSEELSLAEEWAEERAVRGGKALLAAAGPVACEAARPSSSVGRNQGAVAPVFFSPLPFSYLNVAKSISTDQLLQQEHSASPDVTLRAGRLTVGTSLTHSDWPVDVELASSSPAEASGSHLSMGTSHLQSHPEQAHAQAQTICKDARHYPFANHRASMRSCTSLSPGMPGTLLEAAEAASSLHSQQGTLAESPSWSCARGPLHGKTESPTSSPSARETLLAEAAAAEAGAMPAPLVQALDRAPSSEDPEAECESSRHAQHSQQHSPTGMPPPTVAPPLSPAMRALQGVQRESLPTTPITAPLAEDTSTRPSRASSTSPSTSPALGPLHSSHEQHTSNLSPSTPTPSIPPTPTPAATTHLPTAPTPPPRPAFPTSANIRFGKAPAPLATHAPTHAPTRTIHSSSSTCNGAAASVSPHGSTNELPAFSAPVPEQSLHRHSHPQLCSFSNAAASPESGAHTASPRLSISSCAAPSSSLPHPHPQGPPHTHSTQQQHHFASLPTTNTTNTTNNMSSTISSSTQPSLKFSFTLSSNSGTTTSCSTPSASAAHTNAQHQPFATTHQTSISGSTPTPTHATQTTQSGSSSEAQDACAREGVSACTPTQAQSQRAQPQQSTRSADSGSVRGGLSRQLSNSSTLNAHSARHSSSANEATSASVLTAALAQAAHPFGGQHAHTVEGGSCGSSSSGSLVEGAIGCPSKSCSSPCGGEAGGASVQGLSVAGASPSSAVGGPLLAGTDLSQGRGGPSAIARAVQRARKNPQLSSMRLMAGAVMIPHVDKADKGGEDAYCICQAGHGAIGVADGVSGWVEEGIDPAEYSRMLMKHCELALTSAGAEAQGREIIRHAHLATVMPGSSTVCLALMKPEGRLEVVNLGDSGVRVIRDGVVTFASAAQQHMFNMPFQLSHPSIIESPDDADSCSVSIVDVQPGDVIVLATDGLYDNMFDEEIARICGDYMKRRRRSSLRLVGGSDAPPTAAELAAAAVAQARQQQFTSAEAEFLAQEIARLAHNYANDPCRRTPWSVASCEQKFSWAHYFSDGGGKMDDCTVVVAFVQPEHPEHPAPKNSGAACAEAK